MTPRELSIIRCCPEPDAKYENTAVIQDRAFMHHGVEQHHVAAILSALSDRGYLARQRKGVGKYQYRRTDQGQAELSKVAA